MNLGSTHSSPSSNQRNRTISGTTGNPHISFTPNICPMASQAGAEQLGDGAGTFCHRHLHTAEAPADPGDFLPSFSHEANRWAMPVYTLPMSPPSYSIRMAHAPPLPIRIRLYLCRRCRESTGQGHTILYPFEGACLRSRVLTRV